MMLPSTAPINVQMKSPHNSQINTEDKPFVLYFSVPTVYVAAPRRRMNSSARLRWNRDDHSFSCLTVKQRTYLACNRAPRYCTGCPIAPASVQTPGGVEFIPPRFFHS